MLCQVGELGMGTKGACQTCAKGTGTCADDETPTFLEHILIYFYWKSAVMVMVPSKPTNRKPLDLEEKRTTRPKYCGPKKECPQNVSAWTTFLSPQYFFRQQ